MPSPKSGKSPSPAPPTEPAEPKAPINEQGGAAPGASGGSKEGSGATASTKAPPFTPMTKEQAKEQGRKLHFIEIRLVDQDGDPVPHEAYQITMPDGSVASGTLDKHGRARIDGIPDEGTAKVSFPRFDESTWEKK
jgi:hypothetical protein